MTDTKNQKKIKKAQEDVTKAQQALRDAEDALSDAQRAAGASDPGKSFPPKDLEFKTPKDTEKK